MQKRATRLVVVALLLAAAAAAGFLVWQNERTLQALESDRRAREIVIERLAPAIGRIAAAQQAYVDYGQRDDASLVRVSTLLDQITTDAAGLRSSPHSPDSAAHLEEFWVALSGLTTSASQARQQVAAGESLAAADLLFNSARPHVAALDARLRAFREAEFAAFGTARASLVRRSWMALGGVAFLWALGLLALARVPRPATSAATTPAEDDVIAAEVSLMEMADAAPSSPTVDLSAAADLCGAVSRLTDTNALPGILARAAQMIDARGLIVWMGAGDELFAVTAHGYQESVVGRLRPIKRRADNATAAAWRLGELRVVPGDGSGLGAVVAPMFDAGGCVGVLAAELRNGREADPATRALTSILASQLALVLSAWPASSATETQTGAPEALPRSSADSDRQAAAS